MTDAFHQKLLNWICSVGLVLLATVLSMAIGWFKTVPEQMLEASFDTYYILWIVGESLLVYAFYFPVFLTWHFFDFIDGESSPTSPFSRATGYKTIFLTMLVSACLFLAMGLGVGRYNSCDGLDGALFHSCYVGHSLWIMLPWVFTILFALILSIIKAAYSIRFLVKKLK